jgi:hypothetical protein
MVALIGAGCSNAGNGSSSGDEHATNRAKGMKFAECMRDNGVSEFPDPDASGGLTIDGVLNGSSLDPSTPAWKEAVGACKAASLPDAKGRGPDPARRSSGRAGGARRGANWTSTRCTFRTAASTAGRRSTT